MGGLRGSVLLALAAAVACGACDEQALRAPSATRAATRAQAAPWDAVDESVGSVVHVWSNDGSRLAVGGTILDSADGSVAGRFRGTPIAFDAAGTTLAVAVPRANVAADESGPADGFALVDQAGERSRKPGASWLGWAPRGAAYLFTVDEHFTLAAGDRLTKLHPTHILNTAPTFRQDGALVVSAGRRGTRLSLTEVATGAERAGFDLGKVPVDIGWSRRGAWACMAADGVRILHLDGASFASSFKPRSAIRSCVGVERAGVIVVAEGFGPVTLVDSNDGTVVLALPESTPFLRAAFDASGEYLSIAHPDAGVDLVDVKNQSVRRLPGKAARFHPDKPLLLLEGESAVELRDLATLAVVGSVRGSVSQWANQSPFAGSDLVATAHDAVLTIWDTAKAAPRLSVPVRGRAGGATFRSWSDVGLTAKFASFRRQSEEETGKDKPTQVVQEAVLVRLSDGARVALHAVPAGTGAHLFAHTEDGRFDAEDAALEQVYLRRGAEHAPARDRSGLRFEGLLAAFFRGAPLGDGGLGK